MFLESVHLNQFRNYQQLHHKFNPGFNYFVGQNGVGKTNLLEAIYYLSYFTSFRTHKTEILSQDRKKKFSIQIKFNNQKKKNTLGVIHQNGKNEIKHNGRIIKKQIYALGHFKVILFTVRDIDLVLLHPSIRREYFDKILALMKNEYAELLVNYNKLLKIRNQQLKKGIFKKNQDELIISYGTKIIYARKSFLRAIISEFKKIFSTFFPQVPVDILYGLGSGWRKSIIKPFNFTMNNNYYYQRMEEKRSDDERNGFTHFGPHADDYIFQVRNDLCKNNASQGEMRLFVYTLKLSIYEYFKKVIKKTPVILLDDVFNDFDELRIKNFFHYLEGQDQVIVSSANLNINNSYLKKSFNNSFYKIHQGKLIKQ